MKPFPNWRNVGRAMLDARRRKNVRSVVTTISGVFAKDLIEHCWDTASVTVTAQHVPGGSAVDLRVTKTDVEFKAWGVTDPAEVLRVLAALDLVPADIAYAADERYGRCQVCGELAQWVPPSGQFAGRWCHLNPDRPYHRPEVAK